MKLLVKGNVFPNIETLEELNLKYVNYNEETLIELPNNAKIGRNGDNKHLKGSNYHPYYNLLRNYKESNDNSLENFVVINHKIVASGDIKKDEKNKDLYICNDKLRVYTRLFTTFDLILSGEMGGEDLAYFYELMLKNSEVTPSQEKTR